jgi:hypothetical protein
VTLAEIYDNQPTLENELILLRPILEGDAEALLKCYGDETPCRFSTRTTATGTTSTTRRLPYARGDGLLGVQLPLAQFARWAMEDQSLRAVVGTVEMFHEDGAGAGGPWGVLRIDVQSRFETRAFLYAVISLCLRHFYEGFEVERIFVKAIPPATERRAALAAAGFTEAEGGLRGHPFYFLRNRSV